MREAAAQAALHDLRYPVARIVHYFADASVLGGPFQRMKRLASAPMLLAVVRAAHSLLGIGEQRERLFADETAPSNPTPYDDERAIAGFVETIREATGIHVGLTS